MGDSQMAPASGRSARTWEPILDLFPDWLDISMPQDDGKHLAWFLGPKAENASVLEDLLLVILRDYLHWRRNYFPGDKILINKRMQRAFEDEHDAFAQKVLDMIAELRRNFPFYSPRYTAHMLADTTMPSVLGYLAGMLYNPNNVTPEAAPVTVDWEVEACSEILRMLGYRPPPPLPPPDEDPQKYYGREALKEFGWAHITFGGTTANIEALWVCRAVRYFPLSVKEVASRERLDLEIKLPDGNGVKLNEISDAQALLLKPNEAVYMLERFVEAIRKRDGIPVKEAGEKASTLLRTAQYSLTRGTGELFAKFQPVIFVSGAAHYSIAKAADILGIGRGNVVMVKMDSMFRIDIQDLEQHIRFAVRDHKVPLAVIAIAGTTEEGAVDAVHEIIDLRARLEKENISFWVHVDAAWGGYIRTLFNIEEDDFNNWVLSRLSQKLGVTYRGDIGEWHGVFAKRIDKRVKKLIEKQHLQDEHRQWVENHLSMLRRVLQDEGANAYIKSLKQFVGDFRSRLFSEAFSGPLTVESILRWPSFLESFRQPPDPKRGAAIKHLANLLSKEIRNFVEIYDRHQPLTEKWKRAIVDDLNQMLTADSIYDPDVFADLELGEEATAILNSEPGSRSPADTLRLNRLLFEALYSKEVAKSEAVSEEDFNLRLQGRIEIINEFVQDEIEIHWGNYRKRSRIMWGAQGVCASFMSFQRADSVTVDPHKLGYAAYPCGIVAFKNDRVRHFVLQKAPYITSAKQNSLAHVPPKHAELSDVEGDGHKIHVDSFGAFILEGSRPGAAAASLWLSVQTIPLTLKRHGAIIRASLLAARELYEWLTRWGTIMKENRQDTDYEFVPLTPLQPDTNVVIFSVRKRTSSHLATMNKLTAAVYERFAIQTELGEREYSYSQPFFISKTTVSEPEYPFDTVRDFLVRCGFESDPRDYRKAGVVLLRATVMNPYIYPMKRFAGQNIIKEFVSELAFAASEGVKTL